MSSPRPLPQETGDEFFRVLRPPASTAANPSMAAAPIHDQVVESTGPTNFLSSSELLEAAKLKWQQVFSEPQPTAESSSTRPMTNANLRDNVPWGDPLGEKAPGTTRVYSININGISVDRRGGTFDHMCRIVKSVQADILCVQEHNVDSTQSAVRSILFDTAKKHWRRHKMTIGTTPITVGSTYKPGGTMQMTVDSLTGRIVAQKRDHYGRWVLQEFIGKKKSKVIIVSAYQPVDKSGAPGKITVAAQQVSLLTMANDSTKNPRTAFRRDLLKELQAYHEQGAAILLMGDFNETLGCDPEGMAMIASKLGLLNAMTQRHGKSTPATYARGSRTLDYALASPRICNAIVSAGYAAFDEHFTSDHRGMYLDLDDTIVFGGETQTLDSGSKRGLLSNNVAQVTEYIREKHRILFGHHNMAERMKRLQLPGNRHSLVEAIDKDVLAASLAAEEKVRKVGEAAWSIALDQARQIVAILTKQLSALKTNIDHSQVLQQDIAKLLEPLDLPTTKTDCNRRLNEAKKSAVDIVINSYFHRDQERQQKIECLEATQTKVDLASAKRLRRMKKAEDVKQLFEKIRYVRMATNSRGVTRLEIPLNPMDDPKECTEWQMIDVPSEILQVLHERNCAHFGQAQGTPFTVPPLSNDLGFRGDGPASTEILEGCYDASQLNDNVQLLLKHLRQVQTLVELPSFPTISDEEFCGKIRSWAESTTTSPSGLHLGHFKALIARHAFTSDAGDEDLTEDFKEKRAELDAMQADLRALHLAILNYALERGYSLKRWQTIANTILFKDDDNVRLHRTRVIHIYEADFNLFLAIKWRIYMYQAEALQALNDGQYGSRPRRNATDPVFIEELQCEISRAVRKPLILVNYDAASCYDRIIQSLGMVVSRKYGVPIQVTQSNASTLEQATYKVRTELGLAETGFSHTENRPIYGTGQGSANSPAIWCMLSSSLFDCYDEIASLAKYQTSTQDLQVSLGMIGFVDDCNGQVNHFLEDGSEQTLQTVVRMTQANAQHWTNLLSASGGALELSKCSFHVLHWIFAKNGAPVLAPKNKAHEQVMVVNDPITGKDHTLQLLSPYQAHKTLGYYKDPAGTQAEQVRRLKAKSDDSTDFLWRCPLTKLEAWTYYYACYLPSIGYPLPSSSLSQKQLEQVQRKAMKIIVPRCGFNRHTKKEILYGPLELGGANFRHLYTEQGIGQVCLFIRNWRLQSTAGKLLRVAVSWFQTQIGTSTSFLRDVKTSLPHLESKWLASMRTFLASIDSFLELDDSYTVPLQRSSDAHIMDVILDSGTFSAGEIRRLNYCRLYLNAVTVSDLVLVSGTHLDLAKLHGQPDIRSSRVDGPRIYQARPDDVEWRLWRKANTLWSDEHQRLAEPLGPWLLTIHEQRARQYAYAYTDQLWIRSIAGAQYRRFRRSASEPNVFRDTGSIHAWTRVPQQARPVEVIRVPNAQGWSLVTVPKLMSIPRSLEPSTFEEYVQSLEPWECELLSHMELPTDPFSVTVALSDGFSGVSDGSVWLKTRGAFGWAISTQLGERAAEGMGPAPGANPNSYRSEAYGLLALLCFLKRLAEFTFYHESWEGTLATDSLSLVNTLHGKHKDDDESTQPDEDDHLVAQLAHLPLDALIPEWDLIAPIQRLLKEMPGLSLQHVRGHQDRSIQYRNLRLLSRLNVDADALANTFQREFGDIRPLALLPEGSGVYLVTPQGTISSKYKQVIRHQAHYKPLMKYLEQRNGWTPAVSKQINWRAHKTCMHRQIKKKDHYVKLVQRTLPTNHQVHRNDPARRGCPLCAHGDEDWTHILRCPHESREHWRVDMIRNLTKVCEKWNTSKDLQRILLHGIQGWLQWSPDPDSPSQFELPSALYDESYERLIEHQNLIGWDQLFLGRFCWLWSDWQDAHYATRPDYQPKQKKTGPTWQVSVICSLWENWYKLWEMRNKDVHGTDEKRSHQIERTNALRTLHELYDCRNQYEPSAQALLMSDIRDHSAKSTWHLKRWIEINGPILRTSMQRAKKLAITGMRSLTTYWKGIT